ncbi:GntR family transcriptional regulator/MocR family aminotransferase [Antricoccus suffuscus]|uniref:GntR family transcriptional regulator/MocR family aminotransferase n=1 Tax=Antricoccus suffuscus TaxID=1629062 RepID=A0A2T1A3E9_9ACTN|nr:PLP-dependent aminotransferase family protein [Antricoccus suffuscus]PRZ43116.1 GntR family transcriptional regulator/MocR family aminotransferase [Antricoccus suffuscus]
MDLFVDLSPGLGRQDAVEAALRTAISAGRLAPGAPLPSTRTLAAELGLARGTVVAAVEQLAVEGLLETRQGALTRVAHVPPPVTATRTQRSSPKAPRADFTGGEPDLTRFPRSWWAAAVRKSLAQADASTLGYGDPRGSIELRAALVDYLGRTRGVTAAVEHVMVLSGFRQTLAMLARVLHRRGHRRIVVEDPALEVHLELLRGAGLECAPISVDADGAQVGMIDQHEVRAAQVTPNHHLPLGVSLSPARRSELAAWAASVDGFIIEDDFDGELRYDRRPLRALQALDPGRIAYCGTASKSVAPGLRLGWCVLPPALVEPAVGALVDMGGPTVSSLDQLAFAELMASGRYDRHVRTVRTEYRRRRDLLSSSLAAQVPGVRLEGVSAGLVGLIRLPADCDEDTVVARLADRSVAVMPLGIFRSTRSHRDEPAIVVNYGRPFGHQFAAAIELLTSALADAIGH